jgi:hypothetical protein
MDDEGPKTRQKKKTAKPQIPLPVDEEEEDYM